MYKISNKIKNECRDGINSRKTNTSRDKNPKKHIPGRVAFTTAIRYSNDSTQQRTREIHGGGGYKFTKSQGKINPFVYIDDVKVFAKKIKENWKP